MLYCWLLLPVLPPLASCVALPPHAGLSLPLDGVPLPLPLLLLVVVVVVVVVPHPEERGGGDASVDAAAAAVDEWPFSWL